MNCVWQPLLCLFRRQGDPKPSDKKLPHYIHRSEFSFDTGIQVKSLENFIYISLDIFREMPHNELTELEAWMYFLASDEPTDILRIVRKCPFFQEMYQDIVNFRYHPKELIAMYSEALRIMDKNSKCCGGRCRYHVRLSQQ